MTKKATFAAGCFWNVEETFGNLPGVVRTTAGYTGGHTEHPTYEEVCGGKTGHAEAVEVEYDPAVISYEKLLKAFWESHDPTTKNRQGPDVGEQYRSAIFYHDEAEQEAALRLKRALEESERFSHKDIVTEIREAGAFYPAEEYHQKYLAKRGLGTCKIE